MTEQIIHIKNMVCPRCITAVSQTLERLHIPFSKVELGKAWVLTDDIDYPALDKALRAQGFELLQNKQQQLVEQVKSLIIDFIHYNEDEDLKINFSDYISRQIGYDYAHLSGLFSKIEGLTIEKYIILQKIEKVKELIEYDEYNFSEIAFKLNYSSVAHLSAQFKAKTGMTPSQYKKLQNKKRNTLDNLTSSSKA